MVDVLIELLILGLAVGTAATTLTQSKIFRWLQTGAQRLHTWLGDLLNCAYCTSHWLAAAAVLAWFNAQDPLSLAVYWLAVTGIAAVISGLITVLFHAGNE